MPAKQGTIGMDAIYNGVYKIGKVYNGVDLVYQSYVNPLIAFIERTIKNVSANEIENITSIGSFAFYNSDLQNIELTNNITNIGSYAFTDCKNLEKITFPNSIDTIGTYAFSGCEKIDSIIIPSSITSLGNGAFTRCLSLKNVSLPTNMTSVPSSLFASCTSLDSITIPSGVTEISSGAFAGCESLESMTILATTPPTITISSDTSILDSNSISSATKIIYVPASSVSAYQTAENWKDLMTRETNPVTFVGI